MRKLVFALFAAVLPAPASAQQPPAPPIAPAAMERMCSAAGAMQFAFGQTGVPGSSSTENRLLGLGLALPETLAPFTRAQPRATEWSGQFMEMTYSVPMANEDSAYLLLDELGWQLEDAGWAISEIEAGNPPLYLIGYGGYVTLEKPAGETRVLIGLDYAGGEVVLSCGRDDLLRIHAGEALGDLPPGTPRPQVPQIAVPPIADARECDSAEMQAQMTGLLATGEPTRFMSDMLARTNYRDRLTGWMMWKLESSGKLTAEELIDLSLGALGAASPGGNPFAQFAMIEEMFPIIERIGSAETTRDPVALCHAMIDFQGWATRVDTITLAQTQALHARLAAEAARLEISLD